jgi:hypothetical protein
MKLKLVRLVIKKIDEPEYRHVVKGTENGITESKAEKVTMGLLRNMNRDEFLVDEEEVENDESGT